MNHCYTVHCPNDSQQTTEMWIKLASEALESFHKSGGHLQQSGGLCPVDT